ncbi:hypothetical protein TIFTF001_031259 [Ficus carica]|uniref:Uncharacterized protein n=1 Tax=Ficus carica TaxID=3494 RepID=A0AA88J4X4_FICCA|nr:hypothetical protein TIFTF001_031259 [Ficus carica]
MALTYVTDSRENATGAGGHRESNIFDSKTQIIEAGQRKRINDRSITWERGRSTVFKGTRVKYVGWHCLKHNLRSVLTEEDFRDMRIKFTIPDDLELRVPDSGETADNPREGRNTLSLDELPNTDYEWKDHYVMARGTINAPGCRWVIPVTWGRPEFLRSRPTKLTPDLQARIKQIMTGHTCPSRVVHRTRSATSKSLVSDLAPNFCFRFFSRDHNYGILKD